MGLWYLGTLVPMVQWHHGTMVVWYHDGMVSWYLGTMVLLWNYLELVVGTWSTYDRARVDLGVISGMGAFDEDSNSPSNSARFISKLARGRPNDGVPFSLGDILHFDNLAFRGVYFLDRNDIRTRRR